MPSGKGRSFLGFNDSNGSVDPMLLEAQGRRIRLAQAIAPRAMEDPGGVAGVMALASSASDDETFASQLTNMYGLAEAGRMAADLMAAPKDVAYIRFQGLSPAMRKAVQRQGFKVPEYGSLDKPGDNKGSGIGRSLPLIGGGIGAITGAIGEEIVAPVGGALMTLGEGATHVFRAAQAAEDIDDRFFGLGSYNPMNWGDAWAQTGNGKTYVKKSDRAHLKKTYDLDDEDLDLYLRLSQGKLPGELAEDEELDIGTPEHADRVAFLYDLMKDDLGAELVGDPLNGADGVLNNYRVSAGRTFAREMLVMKPEDLDHGLGKLASGSMDLAYAIVMDPTLFVGKVSKGARLGRYALSSMDDVERALDVAAIVKRLDAGELVEQTARLQLTKAEGLRVVNIVENGEVIDTVAKSRLAYGRRVNTALERIARAFPEAGGANADEVAQSFLDIVREQPNMLEAWGSLSRYHNDLIAVGERGLNDVDELTEFLRSKDGYLTMLGKFGGRNTAEYLRLPEIGKTGAARLKAKGWWLKKIDQSAQLDRRLAEEIGVAPGRFSQVARAFQVMPMPAANDPTKTISPLLNTVRRGRIALKPISGSLTRVLTTHVPHGGWIRLYEDGAIADFERLTHLGRTVGMDSAKIDQYLLDFAYTYGDAADNAHGLLAQSAGQRAMVLRRFNSELLSTFDIEPGSKIYQKFVGHLDEVYHLSAEGDIPAKTMAVLASQQAQAMAIPSMRDLVLTSNRYSVTRALIGRGGVFNPGMVDAALSRYWKPAVLMRMGFVARAAGEELLAYLARYGMGSYVGMQLGMDSQRKVLYTQLMENVGDVPTKEWMRDALSKTPDEWANLVTLKGGLHAGAEIPTPRDVLTWGQSQALTPLTAAINRFDRFVGKVLTGGYETAEEMPKWAQRANAFSREMDITVLRGSIRARKLFQQTAEASTIVQRLPGLHRAAGMLDAVIQPAYAHYGMDFSLFTDIAKSARIPTKVQMGKLLAGLDDDSYDVLRGMLTDPVIRRAQLEHLGGISLLPGRVEDAERARSISIRQRDGGIHSARVVPKSNETTKMFRPEGGPELADYYARYEDRLRQLFGGGEGLDEAIFSTLPHHLTDGMIGSITRPFKGTRWDLEDPVEMTREIVAELKALPGGTHAQIRRALEEGTYREELALLAGQESITPDLKDLYERLGQVDDPAAQFALMNPKLNPALVSNDWEATTAKLRTEIKKQFSRPESIRRLQGLEIYADNLTRPPLKGYVPSYGVATDRATSSWALQALDRGADPELHQAFVANLANRLKTRGYDPHLAERIGEELFGAQRSLGPLHDTWVAAERGNSIPLSLVSSSDNGLMDDVVSALTDESGRSFHMFRSDIAESELAQRASVELLDGGTDWQQSVLWRAQMQHFSTMDPLPMAARKYMIPTPEVEMTMGPQTWRPRIWDEQNGTVFDLIQDLPQAPPDLHRIIVVKDGDGNVLGAFTRETPQDEMYDTLMSFDPGEMHFSFKDIDDATLEEAGELAASRDPEAMWARLGTDDTTMFAIDGEVPDGVEMIGDAADISTNFTIRPVEFEHQVMGERNVSKWMDEDEVAEVAAALGGPLDPGGADDLFDRARAALTGLEDPTVADRLDAAKAMGGRLDAEAVAARNAVVADLDALTPGWRGARAVDGEDIPANLLGWDRPGIGEWFGISTNEPTIDNASKVLTTGTTPGQKTDEMIDNVVEHVVRHLTNARSGGTAQQRVLHEVLTPISAGGKSAIGTDLAIRAPLQDMPLETFGQEYVAASNFAWDRITNFFFDDVAGSAIASIVRTPLFATNYVNSHKLLAGVETLLTDSALAEKLAPMLEKKLGMTLDDLEEAVQMERHGMLQFPDVDDTLRPTSEGIWDDVNRELAGEQLPVSDSWANSGLRPPNPKFPIGEANSMLRFQLGIDDPENARILREVAQAVRDDIAGQGEDALQAALDLGYGMDEAKGARNRFLTENGEVHERMVEQAVAAERAKMVDAGDLIEDLTGPELGQLRRYMNMRRNALDTVRNAAMERAFEGVIPYIDDHRIRSQFQEYVGSLVPFWFAEEQFLKRWTRILAESPEVMRKGQLMMHGLRTIGFVKEDFEGNEYFIYPGSAAATSFLSETPVAKVLFGKEAGLPVGLSLTGDVKNTLPGFGDQVGVPSAGPFVGIALEMLGTRSPEWAVAQRSIMGDRGSDRALFSYLVPTSWTRFYQAKFGEVTEAGLASALVQTAQMMEASGHGLKEDATPFEQQEYIDKVEANARTVLMVRAVYGFMGPASPAISTELPLSDEFRALTTSGLDYTEALEVFLRHHDGDASPYTVSKSEVPGGAPMAATDEALVAMHEHEELIRQFPMAAAWMILPQRTSDDEFVNRAYRQQIRLGLRNRRSLPEYINSLAWADASPGYFDVVAEYDARIEATKILDDRSAQRLVEEEKRAWQTSYKNAHPILADKLASAEGRVERSTLLREAYSLIELPIMDKQPEMVEMLRKYRDYDDALVGLNTSRAGAVVAHKAELTETFQSWLGFHLRKYPFLRPFYDRVLRPELRWETQAQGGPI